MRWYGAYLAVAALVAGCGHRAAPEAPAAGGLVQIHPANIARIAASMPAGYEVGGTGVSTPAAAWGTPAPTVRPPGCAVLADPLGTPTGVARGVSASGPGGIVYAVATAPAAGPVAPDRRVRTDCGHWNLSQGHTTAQVDLVDAPDVDGAVTLGMSARIAIVVEGGTETDLHADTFAAYLGSCYVFTAVVTDPGAPHPGLPGRFAADLLQTAVSVLRG